MGPDDDQIPGEIEHISILGRMHALSLASVDRSLAPNSAIAFSGGIDSSILVRLAGIVRRNKKVSLIRLGTANSQDLKPDAGFSDLEFPLTTHTVSSKAVENAALEVHRRLGAQSLAHLEDCAAFLLLGRELSKSEESRTLLTANGPDELFCGYDKFRRILQAGGNAAQLEAEIRRALGAARTLQARISSLLDGVGIRCMAPFLEEDFARFALNEVPLGLKICGPDDLLRKRIWRSYGEYLQLDKPVVLRRKKAMQYSMGIHPIVRKLLRDGRVSVSSNDV